MPRVLRRLLTGLAFLVFALGLLVLGKLLIPRHLRRTRGLGPEEREAARRRFLLAAYGWFVGYMRRSGLITFEPPPLPPILYEGPCVVVANHPSLIDVLAIKATVPGITCVVRSDLYEHWALRPILTLGRDVPGPDRRRVSVGDTAVLDAFVERLAGGDPVLVFPEGTRSPERGLRRFRRGAIEAAVRAGVPVLPLVVDVQPPTLKHGAPWWQVPDRRVNVSLRFLPPCPTQPDTDSAALARSLRARFADELGLTGP